MSFNECDKDFKFLADLLPRYDGNPKLLNFYIREVENIIQLLSEPSRVHPAFICLIKSKLGGVAIDAIAYEESLITWDSIKNALIRRLGEPRNEIQVMQELTRTRRNKYEDAETFGKRLRELLDTLYSVGKHGDRSYYEEMVIEQYTNQLDINVSLGVRISKPLTLESAIMAVRQEEARLVHSKPFYNGSPASHFKQKDAPRVSQQRNIPSRNFIGTQPQHHQPSNIINRQNMSIPPTPNFKRNLGNFRNSISANFRQFNVPQKQVTPKISSDVTMRSVRKPDTPQYAVQNVFYTQGQPVLYGNECHSNYNEGEYPYHVVQEPEEEYQHLPQTQKMPDQT
ncbi:unnamed protein product [Leptidea sinapis]|uniref:Retrotransposon gag domain-containing protein n=1 Tax=Leptidea sinapis TaxID=189913 RepID=A0A5E4QXF4_9NEOP|nr:unnamed protein product [Leptidea sinapis]